jgi:hypothetical protein
MGFRFRKSIKIAPGVRFNLGKKSSSFSFGGRGVRHTISSSGRRTTTVGIPGTGLSYSHSSGGKTTKSSTSKGRNSMNRKKTKNIGARGEELPETPFYLRWWFLLIVVIVMVSAVKSCGNDANEYTPDPGPSATTSQSSTAKPPEASQKPATHVEEKKETPSVQEVPLTVVRDEPKEDVKPEVVEQATEEQKADVPPVETPPVIEAPPSEETPVVEVPAVQEPVYEEPKTEEPAHKEPVGTTYVLNKNSKRFHYDWCSSVDEMSEKNKLVVTGTREDVFSYGKYEPCKRCNP